MPGAVIVMAATDCGHLKRHLFSHRAFRRDFQVEGIAGAGPGQARPSPGVPAGLGNVAALSAE